MKHAIALAAALTVAACTESKENAQAADMPAPLPSVEEVIAKQQFDVFGEPAIVGTPADAREILADYLSRGRVTHLVCGMALSGLDPHLIRASMEIFAKDVIPAFRN